MLQDLPGKAPGPIGERPAWRRSERAVSKAALVVAVLGFGLSMLIALLSR